MNDNLLYEIVGDGATYQADTRAGAKRAVEAHYYDDGLGGELAVYFRDRKIADVRMGEFGIVYLTNQGESAW